MLRTTPVALVLTLAAVAACSSTGLNPDRDIASDLWSELEGFEDWGHFEGLAGIQPGDGSHGTFIQTQINTIAAESQDVLPPGSILIKSNYRHADQTMPDSYVVMERRVGYDPRHNDWFYATYSKEGKVEQAGAADSCVNCHRAAGGGDYVFYND